MFRKKRYKSKRRFHSAHKKQQRAEEKLRETLNPSDTFQVAGIGVKVHLTRSFASRKEYFFEFGRLETDRKKFFFKQVFGENDLDDLINAIKDAKEYCRMLRACDHGHSRGSDDWPSRKRR